MADLFPNAEVFVADSFRVGGLFPTPLVVATLKDAETVNAELTATILSRSQRERSTILSNVGGWHSADLLCWSGVAGKAVIDAAHVMVDRMTLMDSSDSPVPARVSWRVTAWANINHAGHSNRPHGHPGAFWSGVYWVDDGDADKDDAVGGLLELADPRGLLPAMNAPHLYYAVEDCMSAGRGQTVTPKSGTMVLFPSWLIHSVTTYRGGRPRISIAFNFSL